VRSKELVVFLQTLQAAILNAAPEGSAEQRTIQRISAALLSEKSSGERPPVSLPLCNLLDELIENLCVDNLPNASASSPIDATVKAHARALQDLSKQLTWWQRPDSIEVGEPFASGHANATVVGKGGLEERDDVWIGISLLAPNINYPEHHHPPEEVYLVMSPGEWRQGDKPWHSPGCGALVHNPPDILHAMRSGSQPLLATWCLCAG